MKKILIGGCSFSQTQNWPEEKNPPWIPWTDLLQREYGNTHEIVNLAKSSFGQSKIVESILGELVQRDFNVDCVLIQWSAVGRGYAVNQKDLDLGFITSQHEYILESKMFGKTTDVLNVIDYSFYINSLNQIYLLKTLLKEKNIPFKMFWGWQQINDTIRGISPLLNLIYDEDFWRWETHGGMREYITSKLGAKDGVGGTELHPTTKGQTYFYNTIIKNFLNNLDI
jgi:hypothetical protein